MKKAVELYFEQLKFNLNYYWQARVRQPINQIKDGIQNLWVWFPIIWHDRWWDYSFMHNMLAFKLKRMQHGWAGAHYIECEKEERKLAELISILNEIKNLETHCSIESDQKIEELYAKFGQELFGIIETKHTTKEGKEITKRESQFTKFWD